MQVLDLYQQDVERWLVDLMENGPPHMESYGSIFDELNVILQSRESLDPLHAESLLQSQDPSTSTTPDSTSIIVPKYATSTVDTSVRRRGRSLPETAVPRAVTVDHPTSPDVHKALPYPPILPPLCLAQPYNLSTDSSKKIHEIINTFNEYANSLEFVGRLGEAEITRELVIFSAIPLFILLEFVRKARSPLEKAKKVSSNTLATEDARAVDMTVALREISDAVNNMRDRSKDWEETVNEKLTVALSRADPSSFEKGIEYLRRTYESWRTACMFAGFAVVLAGHIGGQVAPGHTLKLVLNAGGLIITTPTPFGLSGEVAQTRANVRENCHGKIQDFKIPSIKIIVRELEDIMKKLNAAVPSWDEDANDRLTKFAKEVGSPPAASVIFCR
ncbi:hypothetical protein FRB90_010543 [Tulasnella sp. 427]|nr:hypothetical protein FRB90_010543 [Tulasnella sp. 427]